MANEPTDEDRANAKVALISVQSYPSHSQVVRDVVAAALAAERERCAKESDALADKHRSNSAFGQTLSDEDLHKEDALADAFQEFAAAIRALGRGKP